MWAAAMSTFPAHCIWTVMQGQGYGGAGSRSGCPLLSGWAAAQWPGTPVCVCVCVCVCAWANSAHP
eukprot:1162122-Pelagomonas_calceolata.AAC.2